MKATYAVTFEFPLRPPLTHRGTVEAGQAHVCVARATKEAQRLLRPRGWSSIAVALQARELSAKEILELEEPTVTDPADRLR
jgi:hypothetical protein